MIKYDNIVLNKSIILRDNKGKIAVYRLINNTTNKSYVGSSGNLSNRLKKYYSNSYLTSKMLKYNSRIYRSILKYNHFNFSLEILEYCTKESLVNREQYYMDLIKPEYNIFKIAGSSLGFKHSAKTKLKLKRRKPSTGHVTIVINRNNQSRLEYSSVRSAAKSLEVSHTTLLRYINNKKLLKDVYIITK